VKLRQCGATEAECNFLASGGRPGGWIGRRIELNAMDSVPFITYLENKLIAFGVAEKVVPAADVLQAAWRRAWLRAKVQEAIDKAVEEVETEEIEVPADIAQQVKERLTGSDEAWDDVLWRLVRDKRESVTIDQVEDDAE
jgi:hypothetical protein